MPVGRCATAPSGCSPRRGESPRVRAPRPAGHGALGERLLERRLPGGDGYSSAGASGVARVATAEGPGLHPRTVGRRENRPRRRGPGGRRPRALVRAVRLVGGANGRGRGQESVACPALPYRPRSRLWRDRLGNPVEPGSPEVNAGARRASRPMRGRADRCRFVPARRGQTATRASGKATAPSSPPHPRARAPIADPGGTSLLARTGPPRGTGPRPQGRLQGGRSVSGLAGAPNRVPAAPVTTVVRPRAGEPPWPDRTVGTERHRSASPRVGTRSGRAPANGCSRSAGARGGNRPAPPFGPPEGSGARRRPSSNEALAYLRRERLRPSRRHRHRRGCR